MVVVRPIERIAPTKYAPMPPIMIKTPFQWQGHQKYGIPRIVR